MQTYPSICSTRGSVLSVLLLLIALAGVVGFVSWIYNCPCERTPGSYLIGTEVSEQVTDWSFANDVPLCQIQVSAGLIPHSVNLNCMSADGELFLSCASCEGKHWSTAILENPHARLRMLDLVYPVTVTRIIDPQMLDRAWIAREAKLGRPIDRPRQAGWWSFQVISR